MVNGYFDGMIGRVRQSALIAAVGGLGAAGYGFFHSHEVQTTMRDGVEAVAQVNHITEMHGRRGSRTYSANVSWHDASGATRIGDVHITDVFAQRYIVGDQITLTEVKVKYLADKPEAQPIVAEDASRQMERDDLLMKIGAGAGGAGLLGSILLFLFRGRPKETLANAPPNGG